MKKYFSSVKNDILGGISSGLISLPSAIAFGLLAFAPLGTEYMNLGILSGIFSAIIAGIISPWLNSAKILIYGPGAPQSLVIASMISYFLSLDSLYTGGVLNLSLLLGLVFSIVILSGLLLLLFGILRFGILIQYISSPVNTGILNGAVLLIFMGQIGPILGLDDFHFSEFFSRFDEIKWTTAFIALFTFALMLFGKKITSRTPPAILAIFAGSLLYYLFAHLGFGEQLTGTVATPPEDVLSIIDVPGVIATFGSDLFFEQIMPIFSAAFSIAILSAVDTLLGAACLQSTTGIRPNGNRELVALGAGTAISGIFSGLATIGSLGRAKANFDAGGRGPLSASTDALTLLILLLFFSPYIGYLPNAVTAGIVLGLAMMLADPWMWQIVAKLRKSKKSRSWELLQNLFLMGATLIFTVFMDLIAAVISAVALSIILYIVQMSRTGIRKVYPTSISKVKKERLDIHQTILYLFRNEIMVVELEGSLFFGSANLLAQKIEDLMQEGARFIVLDFKYVKRFDSSTAMMLELICNQIRTQNGDIAFSNIKQGSFLWELMVDFDLVDKIEFSNIFQDPNMAIEFFEDQVLDDFKNILPSTISVDVETILKQKGMDENDIPVFVRYLHSCSFDFGEKIITENEPGDSMYFLTQGEAAVVISKEIIIQTFAPGAMFGEMAFLDGNPRSADIISVQESTCYRLSLENFERLRSEHPNILSGFYKMLATLISRRQRALNLMITELKV